MLVIGIDEAGYGPLLGPLVVAGSAFRVDPEPAGDAIEPGRRIAAAFTGGGRRPLVRVGDSKQVYRGGGLAALERPVLLFGCLIGTDVPHDLDTLLGNVGADPAERHGRRWYSGEPPRFPISADPREIAADAARLGEQMRKHGVAPVALASSVVPESRLNGMFEASGNKADTLFDLSASVFDRLAEHAEPGEPIVAVFDRHGGRKHYLPPLSARWPGTFLWLVEENARTSAYRGSLDGRNVSFRFQVGGDALDPQVGLASMLAKYLREIYMTLWNGWFAEICPSVRPTAGYTQDGRRWLDESRAARLVAGIPDELLMRTR